MRDSVFEPVDFALMGNALDVLLDIVREWSFWRGKVDWLMWRFVQHLVSFIPTQEFYLKEKILTGYFVVCEKFNSDDLTSLKA